MTGYLHPIYAETLSDFGRSQLLQHSGGHLLVRKIPNTNIEDAMGCYPLFCCDDWKGLSEDLEALRDQIVSVALVTDPFGNSDVEDLRRSFPDKMFHFKDHFVVDFNVDCSTKISSNHRRNLDKAMREVAVEHCEPESSVLEDWVSLYDVLIQRHQIKGLTAFSRGAFEKLFKVPGLVAFRSVHQGETVGMTLWLTHGNISYYHLGAYSERGYELGASFPIFQAAIEYFRSQGLRGLNLGAGAGIGMKQQDGLSRFKQGWANATRPVYFCGRIFDQDRYSQIMSEKGLSANEYFPAYRLGEFQSHEVNK
jgi:Acetyltransferase (GNAT) domain